MKSDMEIALCMITSVAQNLPPILVFTQNSSQISGTLNCFHMGILFIFAALGIRS